MECNKDEALRAKQIAENKMQIGDFVGALKVALKAQKLLPDIENIVQIITICEVHCAAQNKLAPSEMDWYGVLLIERFSDEATIKKQYRKLALLLHPDKNKFAGAEAAFKLIGEANGVLSDQVKRSVYDMKCRASMRATVPKPSTQQSNGNAFAKDHNGNARYFGNSFNSQPTSWSSQQPVQQQTFWTSCPHCLTRFQYYRTIVNATLRCQQCSKSFIASDMGAKGVPPGYSWTPFNNQKDAPNKGSPKAASQSNGVKPCGAIPKDESMQSDPVSMTKCTAGMSKTSAFRARESQTSASVGSKRARPSVPDSRENCKTGSGEDMEHAHVPDIGADSSGPNAGIPPRRSSRPKQHVSYTETLHDNDSESPSKRARKSESSSTAPTNAGFFSHSNSGNSAANMGSQYGEVKNKESGPPEGTTLNGKSKNEQSHGYKEETPKSDAHDRKSKADDCSSDNPNDQSHAAEILYPDPEFNNFDKEKEENCFAVNQIWAIYDPTDGMPRFYARVKKVLSPGFKLLITWLEANPDDPGEIDWNDAELPVACGKFRLGRTQKTEDRLMFSHQIDCIKGSSGGTYLVFPKKGEIWAIFSDWDIGWSSNPEKHSKYDFEFVEVWSGFVENVGIEVSYLGKVKGFVSLFQHTKKNGISVFCVPPNELYRFSHRIPSFKMTGNEREGVPIGSFELDPAGLPINLLDIGSPVKVDNGILNAGINSSFHESSEHKEEQLTADDIHKPMMEESKNAERVSSVLRRSPRGGSNRKNMDHGQLNTSPHMIREENGKDMGHRDINEQEGSAAVCQDSERLKTPKKHEKNNFQGEIFNVRRSPRDLSKKNAQVDAAQSATGETTDKCFAQSVGSASSSCNEKLHPKVDGSSSDMKGGSVDTSDMTFCYDFNKEKSVEKFQCDQIWALYDEKDRMPKIYAKIIKIEYASDFRLHVALLEPCSPPKGTNHAVSCGTFRVKNAKTQIALRTAFSHQVRVEQMANNRYEIYPRKGEVWALYGDQNYELKNTGRGECCIVEVLADSDKSIQVVILTRLFESKPFFKAPRSQRSKTGILEILRADVGRFSHQIPAKVDNVLFRGCWELDMSSVPGCVLR